MHTLVHTCTHILLTHNVILTHTHTHTHTHTLYSFNAVAMTIPLIGYDTILLLFLLFHRLVHHPIVLRAVPQPTQIVFGIAI